VAADRDLPLSVLLSQLLIAHTIELDNEFERRLAASGASPRVVSIVMWSNFLRFVEHGIAVSELQQATQLPAARTLSMLAGMERWGYVCVAPRQAAGPPKTRRDGFGSARGVHGEWIVRPTPAGRTAQRLWPSLLTEIDQRWVERFAPGSIEELRSALRSIVSGLGVEFPEYLPIVAPSDGMVSTVSAIRTVTPSDDYRLSVLLSRVLLAYTIHFEHHSDCSLPLSANFLPRLASGSVAVNELPVAAGVSKEATSMALTYLAKRGHAAVEGSSWSSKRARLTAGSRTLLRRADPLHAEIEEEWQQQLGAHDVARLRTALGAVLEQRDAGGLPLLSSGLKPHPGGWRARGPYLKQTLAMIADPRRGLPRHPIVLHRGGWPDGS